MVFLPDQSGFNIVPVYRASLSCQSIVPVYRATQRDFDRFYFGMSDRNAGVAGFTKPSFKLTWYWPAALLHVIGA